MPSRKKSREQRLADRLLRGASKGALSEARAIIQDGAQVTCFDQNGSTPLHLACRSGHLDMVEMLIEKGAPINIMGTSNYSPIHLAARGGHEHVIEPLHKSGAVLNIETKFEKRTSLHIAASAGWVEVVRVLLELGAQPNKLDIYGSTPLQIASMAGKANTVKLLLEHEADVSIADRDGWSALHFAAQNGHTELIPILLEGNAQIDAQTKYGRTPLHCACASRNLSTVEALLSRGASITIKDAHGKTAMDSCKDPKVLQIISIFAQDQAPNFSQSLDSIAWYLPENKLMSMQSISVNTEPDKDMVKRKFSRMFSSVPDFKSVGEVDNADGEDDEMGLSPQERELFKMPEVEPLKKIYRKMLITLKSLFGILDLRHDTMQKHVAAAIKSRSIAASTENIKEIHVELQSLKQNVEDFRMELPAELQTLVRCLHDFVESVEGGVANLKSSSASESTSSQESSPEEPGRKHAVTGTGPVPSLNDLARELGDKQTTDIETTTSGIYRQSGATDENDTNVNPWQMASKRQSSMFEEDAAEVAQHIRVFHHVAAILGGKKGNWKKMHFHLHSSLPEPITQATARGIEENYQSDSDRAFESLWAWFWQRQSASIDPLTMIIESLEEIGINTKHVDAIKALAAADNDNSTVASDMESDSDTLSAGDSDEADDYMDGVQVPEDESDYEEEALDKFDTNKVLSDDPEEMEKDRLTHMQKIKAQRKISSTPLHDYKNPSRILDPEFIRGMIPPDKSVITSTPDLNHNRRQDNTHRIDRDSSRSPTKSSSSVSISSDSSYSSAKSPSRVRFSVVEQEDSDVFIDLNTSAENNEEEMREVEKNNNDTKVNKCDGELEENQVFLNLPSGQKQRKNGSVCNPFMNDINSEKSTSLQLGIQHENAFGKTVESQEREQAKLSLIRLASSSSKSRISSDTTCRSWSNSSEDYHHFLTASVAEKETSTPTKTTRDPHVTLQNTSTNDSAGQHIVQNANRSSPSGYNNKTPETDSASSKPSMEVSTSSGSDPETDSQNGADQRNNYNVISLRPRTFTDTSTDDDEIRQNVRERIKRMKKSSGESDA